MKATLATRKPVDQITIEDLRTFPVWEFATDEEDQPGRDETWIKPVKTAVVPAGAFSQLVAASFSTGATDWMGFMEVSTARQPFELSPGAIVTPDAYYFIPSPGMVGAVRVRAALAQALGFTFPLSYSLRVAIAGESRLRQGSID